MAIHPGYTVPRSEIENYIRQAAAARGIDPEIAVTVFKREGMQNFKSQIKGGKFGKQEPSYGPFQLLKGGGDTGYGTGLGNKFQAKTGLDPSNPNTWRQNVDFALDEAVSGGWGPWYGAKAAGITGKEGIGANAKPVGVLSGGTASYPPIDQPSAVPSSDPRSALAARGVRSGALAMPSRANVLPSMFPAPKPGAVAPTAANPYVPAPTPAAVPPVQFTPQTSSPDGVLAGGGAGILGSLGSLASLFQPQAPPSYDVPTPPSLGPGNPGVASAASAGLQKLMDKKRSPGLLELALAMTGGQ